MSVLVRAAKLSKADEKGRNSLSDDEIFGNLFIYNLAGHETTANTLAYAVALMATNRGVQDWVGEEIDAVFGSEEDVKTWQYEMAFPATQAMPGTNVRNSASIRAGDFHPQVHK
jgi:cytochrome P450